MMMKKFLTILCALALSAAAFAQTAEEIVARMDAQMNEIETDGFSMTMEIKIPILGSMSTRAYTKGDNLRMEAEVMGEKVITWQSADTEWTYTPAKNTIEIENHTSEKKSDEQENMQMFHDTTEGYDLSIKKETADAWYILCKKNKSNKDKDAPKTMDLVVAKGSYYPMSLSAKVKGITVTMRDLGFDVTDADVTFDPSQYPGVEIVDKR